MNEIWKQVDGFKRYYVSNLGRVKSVYKHRPERILKCSVTDKGYLTVSFSKEGKGKTISVHRLVSRAFLPNHDNLPQINHIDEDKRNNEVTNLEWCDGFHNQEHSHAKHYTFISPEGEVVSVFNLNKFCREHSLPVGNMCKLHQGLHHKIKGWTKASA